MATQLINRILHVEPPTMIGDMRQLFLQNHGVAVERAKTYTDGLHALAGTPGSNYSGMDAYDALLIAEHLGHKKLGISLAVEAIHDGFNNNRKTFILGDEEAAQGHIVEVKNVIYLPKKLKFHDVLDSILRYAPRR